MSGRFSVGDLVWTWNLPDEKKETVWHKLDKPVIGVIVEVKDLNRPGFGFFNQVLHVKFASGDIITMSSNLIEPINSKDLFSEYKN